MRKKVSPEEGKVSQTVSAEASPDSKCPICLDRFNNEAKLDRCLHKFCFRCIHEWSKNKAECPLCKQPFNSIFHSYNAKNDFKKFTLRPTENGSFGFPEGERFRYRTTLARDRRQINSMRRTSPPPDNGIMFEGLTGSGPAQHDRGLHPMILRFNARRRAQNEGRSFRHMREREIINFRRALYRSGVRVRSVRDGGRYRDISAEFFQRNPACLHRLVPWLKRELTVLYGSHGSLVNIVQHIIMTRITTDHFLHEFISFARAPYNMEAYDQHAIYDCPAPSYEEGSSSGSSVITISADEADSAELDQRPLSVAGSGLSQTPWDDETPGPSYSTVEQVQPPSLTVSESESESSREEEVGPGPSLQQSAQVKMDPSANEGAGASSSEEDCLIVGYVKPMAERTPELVQLSSDSEEESIHNENTEVPKQPAHIRFPSMSPPSSVCSSVSKTKSPQRHHQSRNQSEGKDRDQTAFEEKVRHSPMRRSSPTTERDRTLRVHDKGKHYSKDRHACNDHRGYHWRHRSRERSRSRSKERSHQRSRRRSRSTERSWSKRSPTISINSDSTLSRGKRHSRSRSRDYPSSRDMTWLKNRDKDNSYPRHSHEKSYSYHWDTYSHYNRERDSSDAFYMQNRSYCTGYYMSPDYGVHSRSQSRSRSSSHRDSYRWERRHSRSLSSTSSQGSRGAHRGHRHEKPSGKRKYKTRHLEESSRERTSKSQVTSSSNVREKRGSSERHHKKSRKKSRSPSVVIIYEGKSTGESRRHHKKKKKHKKKSRKHRSRERVQLPSPTVITIDSDSDHTIEPNDGCPISSENEISTTTGNCVETPVLVSGVQAFEEIKPFSFDLKLSVPPEGVVNSEAVSSEASLANEKWDTGNSVSRQSSFASEDETSTTSPLNAREVLSLESNGLETSSEETAAPLQTGSETEYQEESTCRTPPP
ncbi:TOPRS ligase, partial [Amia calva]|nr:TOPRS ligase [Amia calva]